MKTVSIINLKGGVAKTLTTVSMAYALSQQYKARVLVVDNEKQGNCSKTFGVHSYDRMSNCRSDARPRCRFGRGYSAHQVRPH